MAKFLCISEFLSIFETGGEEEDGDLIYSSNTTKKVV
ncbi:MAG: hypothetical protein HeimC3_12940 [Candidatus Heimdallarchaeota archaeon LC_3]|nr:MAG: hypothetical protein HeimC3_12940 [Candidatus Heimdallarchaeota archaeon LC_3]